MPGKNNSDKHRTSKFESNESKNKRSQRHISSSEEEGKLVQSGSNRDYKKTQKDTKSDEKYIYKSRFDEEKHHRKHGQKSSTVRGTNQPKRGDHKSKDQSPNRDSRKHKKPRDQKDKFKRDKTSDKSKRDKNAHSHEHLSENDSPNESEHNESEGELAADDLRKILLAKRSLVRQAIKDLDEPNATATSVAVTVASLDISDPVSVKPQSPIQQQQDHQHHHQQDHHHHQKDHHHHHQAEEDNSENPNEREMPINSEEDNELAVDEDDNRQDTVEEDHEEYDMHMGFMRSKFESSSHRGSEEEYPEQRSASRSSNSSHCSSESFGSSISSSRNPRKKKRSQSKENRDNLLPPGELEFSPINQNDAASDPEVADIRPLYYPAIQGCRLVEEFECLNKIEEGTYGVVFRARDRKTQEVVALKRLKMEKEKDGFPITSLREINTLMKASHENIVTVREVVVGSNMDKIYLVMDFIEHDLKSLMLSMQKPFEICEVKCLLLQLLHAVAHLHDNWILHRDLKTSNLLLSHKGILKVADFGLAREYGSPLKNYTRIVVTLWYRAPELLLGTKMYSTQIDMWSVGCIFGELVLMTALFPGKSDSDQINILFRELGTPNEKIWPGYNNLPNVKRFEFGRYEYNRLSKKFGNSMSECGMELLNRFLAYCPDRRITAEEALKHPYFAETPRAISPEMFPTRPAKSEGGIVAAALAAARTRVTASPKPPSGGQILKRLNDEQRVFMR